MNLYYMLDIGKYNINFLLNEIIIPNIKYIIFWSIIIFIVSLIIFVILSFFILKYLKKSIDEYNILFNQYSKKSKQILDKYGDNELTNVFIVRQPITNINKFLLNILTFYNFEKLINISDKYFPYHTLLVFEIKIKKNIKKLLFVEKNNYINISENFTIQKSHEIKRLNIKNKSYTLKTILNETEKRLGNEKYFNWHIYKNNCLNFTKEVLITMKTYNKGVKKYINCDKILKIIHPDEFTLHVFYSFINIVNVLEKYIFDVF